VAAAGRTNLAVVYFQMIAAIVSASTNQTDFDFHCYLPIAAIGLVCFAARLKCCFATRLKCCFAIVGSSDSHCYWHYCSYTLAMVVLPSSRCLAYSKELL